MFRRGGGSKSAKGSISASQGLINVFFFFFLDERNISLQSNTIPWLAQERQLSDCPPGNGGPNFLFIELVTCTRRDAPQVTKTCRAGLWGQETVSDSLCFVPFYLLSLCLLSFLFTTFYRVVDHAILSLVTRSFLRWNRVENFKPRTLSPILNSKVTVFFCFHLEPVEENGDFFWLRDEWNNFIECVDLLSASCSFMSVALKCRQITSAHRQQFLSTCGTGVTTITSHEL